MGDKIFLTLRLVDFIIIKNLKQKEKHNHLPSTRVIAYAVKMPDMIW